ncbi:MAG: hypothetical protein JXR37_32775 [Kiritimatiellae bacterium]|nr:hypothetical protein [Kiritimatiellia bacterium]
MSYACPRCGESVRRAGSKGAQMAGGLVGALLAAAFGAFECPKCGKISRSEFPPDVRRKMMKGSLGLVAGAVLVIVLVIVVIAALN